MDGSAAGNVVLVHGGFVDGSGWQGVYSILKKDDYNVRAEPMCSMLRTRRPRLCTIWTAVALEAVVTRRHEHAHPARLPTPTQDVSDHIEALPRQYDTFAAVRFPRIESGNPIVQRSGPSFIEARRSSGYESGIVSASAYSRSAVNSHLMVHVGAAVATSVDPG